MQNKRGVSAIVGTMLLILITIIAIGILWYFANLSFDKGSKEINADCLNLKLEPINCQKTPYCYYYGGKIAYEADVVVKKYPGDGDLTGVRFVFQGQSERAVVIDQSSANFIDLQSKNFVDIAVGGMDPAEVKVSALVGNTNGSCNVLASPVQCVLTTSVVINYGHTPSGPYSSECCQYPWNLTECIPQGLLPGNLPAGKNFCCNKDPTTVNSPTPTICNYNSAGGTCINGFGGGSSVYCNPVTACSAPGEYCNYPIGPTTNNCCINQVYPPGNYNVCI